jgi:hypothetical protein
MGMLIFGKSVVPTQKERKKKERKKEKYSSKQLRWMHFERLIKNSVLICKYSSKTKNVRIIIFFFFCKNTFLFLNY